MPYEPSRMPYELSGVPYEPCGWTRDFDGNVGALITPALFSQPPPRPPGEEGGADSNGFVISTEIAPKLRESKSPARSFFSASGEASLTRARRAADS
jgi:hypothetical protein